MRFSISMLVALSALAVAGCPPTPRPPPPVDGGDSSAPPAPDASPALDASPAPPAPDGGAVGSACANLRALGCKEGTDPNCESVFAKAVAERVTTIDTKCLSTAKDKAAARKCGFVICQ